MPELSAAEITGFAVLLT